MLAVITHFFVPVVDTQTLNDASYCLIKMPMKVILQGINTLLWTNFDYTFPVKQNPFPFPTPEMRIYSHNLIRTLCIVPTTYRSVQTSSCPEMRIRLQAILSIATVDYYVPMHVHINLMPKYIILPTTRIHCECVICLCRSLRACQTGLTTW